MKICERQIILDHKQQEERAQKRKIDFCVLYRIMLSNWSHFIVVSTCIDNVLTCYIMLLINKIIIIKVIKEAFLNEV